VFAGVGRDGDAPMTMSPLAAWLISNMTGDLDADHRASSWPRS